MEFNVVVLTCAGILLSDCVNAKLFLLSSFLKYDCIEFLHGVFCANLLDLHFLNTRPEMHANYEAWHAEK